MKNAAPAILLVDDDRDFAPTEKRLLEMHGYQVIHCSCGEEAVKTLVEDEAPTDLVVMDIDLGFGMDGIEAATHILNRREIPVVFLSANIRPEVVERAESVTSYGYVDKTADFAVLDASIRMALKLFRAKEKRKHAEEKLARESQYRKLVHELSLTFINLPLERLDSAINDSLAEIGLFLEVDRVFVFDYDFSRGTTSNTHEWCAPGIPAEIGNLQNYPIKDVPQWIEPHRQGKALVIEDVPSLPTGALREHLVSQQIKSVITVPLMNSGECIGYVGTDIVSHRARRIGHEEKDLLRLFSELLVSVKLRRQMETELRRSEETRKAIIEALPDLVFRFDGTGTYLDYYASDDNLHAARQPVGRNMREFLPPAVVEEFLRCFGEAHRSGQLQVTEYALDVPAGSREFEGRIVPMAGNDTLVVVRDITEEKHASDQVRQLLQEKEMLLKEVQHRIKNNLNTMSGLLYLQANEIKDPTAKAALNDAMSRFKSIQLVYDQLYRAGTDDSVVLVEYLQQLVSQVVEIFPLSVRVDVRDLSGREGCDETADSVATPCVLRAKQTSSVGLIVNELVTNVMKYAFPHDAGDASQPAGRFIGVTIRCLGAMIEICVEDNGLGMSGPFDPQNPSGFGLSMVHALAAQLGGKARIESSEGPARRGTRVGITFPWDRG